MRIAIRSKIVVACACVVVAGGIVAAADDWVVDRLDIRYDIQADGTIQATDAIDVNFRGAAHHGINRDITAVQQYDEAHNRRYDIALAGPVTAADGQRHDVETLDSGGDRRFRIGDPKRTITGKVTYRIPYRMRGVLNAFSDHDELYWNAVGTWTVPITRATVTVRAPAGGITRADCFQGFKGSTEHCDVRMDANEVRFTATRPLADGEQMSVVVGLRKGAVVEPQPMLTARARDPLRFFDHTPAILDSMYALLITACLGATALWWRVGRDRRYIAAVRASGDQAEERVPLFGGRPIAVEFEPPDGIRPGQMGLLLDERADTLDATATIVDLAVRGYLKITEVEKAHWFSSKDWQLDRLKEADSSLLEYERILLNGLFDTGPSTRLSQLKNTFYDDLAKAKKALYADAVTRGWFPRNPNTVRTLWRIGGVLLAGAGVFAIVWLGMWWGAGLIGLPVVAAGIVLAAMARLMPRRTAAGQDVTWRTLGFLRYIKTAETNQQAFAERANLFTEYLPYAVVFKCVDRWARAFKGIDLRAATAGWYAGGTGFNAADFSSGLGTFSSSVSSTMSSTPGGSGSSGFSGGSSGGGGGGGGGSAW